MKKPEGLHRLLLATVPGLSANAERLTMFVDKGRVASGPGRHLSFEYRYTLAIVIQDYAGDVDAITIPILAWIAEQQPELLKSGDGEPFEFEAEIQNGSTADVSISMELTERVRVTPRPGGGYDVQHLDAVPAADLDRFPGVCGQNLWQLFLRDHLIAETTDPAFVPPAP